MNEAYTHDPRFVLEVPGLLASKKMVWIVFCYKSSGSEFVGVYDSEERAVAACQSETYCVCPIEMNFTTPTETTEWPGCYYPLSNKQ